MVGRLIQPNPLRIMHDKHSSNPAEPRSFRFSVLSYVRLEVQNRDARGPKALSVRFIGRRLLTGEGGPFQSRAQNLRSRCSSISVVASLPGSGPRVEVLELALRLCIEDFQSDQKEGHKGAPRRRVAVQCGGVRALAADSVLLRLQLLNVRRSRRWAPNL